MRSSRTRLAVLLLALLAAGAVVVGAQLGSKATAARTGATRLTIVVVPRPGASAQRYVLACRPARGDLPKPAQACATLARRGWRAFAPVPTGVACTQIYGGPARAHVNGLVAGHRVDVHLRLTDGCQIARWHGVRAIVPLPSGQGLSS